MTLKSKAGPLIRVVACLSVAVLAVPVTGEADSAFSLTSGSPVAAGASPYALTFGPTGKLLVTANYLAGNLSVFTANALTGTLTAATGSPVAAGNGPDAVAFSPNGQELAVTDLVDDSVDVFSVTPSTGALAPDPGSPYATGDQPRAVAFSPSGTFLAVTNAADGTISMFAVDPSTGGLAEVADSPFPAGIDPVSASFSPGGGVLAVANEGDGTVAVYGVGADGSLTAVSGSPFSSGAAPASVAFNPNGSLVAVANSSDDTVAVFSVGAGGALAAVPGSPFPTGSEPLSVAFNAAGTLLATADAFSGDVALFAVAPSGSLSPLPGSPFPAGNGSRGVAFSPDGNVIAVANANSNDLAVLAPTAPSATISLPARRQTYTLGEQVQTSFSCADSAFGPGIASCSDNLGAASPGMLDTSTGGTHTYTVTAASIDGQTSSASITYDVELIPPAETAAPQISGVAAAGDPLYCEEGSWTALPTSFTYSWFRNGMPLAGATSPTYTVGPLDEGSTLSCAVSATNLDTTTSGPVPGRLQIPAPRVRGCPVLQGKLVDDRFGPIRLGETEVQARRAMRQATFTAQGAIGSFCQTPAALEIATPTAALLKTLPASTGAALEGQVVAALTGDPRYTLEGLGAGASLSSAERALLDPHVYSFGSESIVLAPDGDATEVVVAKKAVVAQVGLLAPELSRSLAGELALIRTMK